MALWMLNHLSTLSLALIVVGGIVALSLLGSVLLRRRYPSLARGEHNEMVGVVLGVFGAIYGIILAFVVVTLWTQLETTQSVVSAEATDLALIVRDARVFPQEAQTRVDQAVSDYVRAVVEESWPRMRQGQGDFDATESQMRAMFDALQAYEPQTAKEQAFYGEMVSRLNDVSSQRRARISTASTQLPVLLQALAYGGALVLIPLTFLYGMKRMRMQLLFVAAVSGLIGFTLLLVIVLDRPFAGDLSVSPAAYTQGALERFWYG
ncbi:hypothetical protein GCM10010302_31010 [Streptomyces polychromogenes]|uniref:DUF4239 domain-containing protein n=1 Tax=Streptomyces polychromogenes TaxID=67342 RepID=A0ABP3F0S8_9ACTN